MGIAFKDSPFREVFQNGRWRLFRNVSESNASKYASVTARNYCWQKIKSSHEGKYDASNKSSRNKYVSKRISDQDTAELSEMMKRDILTRVSPWISTTHKDFYGKLHPQLTGKEKNTTSVIKDSKPGDLNKLVCAVKQVPLVRMICYKDKHFVSTYENDFKDQNPDVFKSLQEEEDYFDISRPLGKTDVPYGSKSWITSYKYDYGQLPKAKKSHTTIVVPDCDLEDTSRLLIHKSDWSTSYQDYGYSRKGNLITTIPYPKIPEVSVSKHGKIPVTSQVEKLLKY